VARQEGLDEETVALIDDDYDQRDFAPADVAALCLADAIIGDPSMLDAETRASLAKHFTEAQIAVLSLGVALFHALSKTLIVLGLEPKSMPVTVVPTPGTEPRGHPSAT